MKKSIIYLLLGIFLLFLAEKNQSIDFQKDATTQNISLQSLSFVKKHHPNHSLEKASFQQVNDSLDAPEELNLNFSDSLCTITAFAVFGLGFLFRALYNRQKRKFHEPETIIYPVKRFILIRSIRI